MSYQSLITDPENLSILRGIRNSYLRNIANVENEVLQLISNIDPKNENQKLKLLAKKNSSSEKIEKGKTPDENVIDLLNGEAMQMELDESLARNDYFHELFIKIDMCLKTLENELRNISLNNRPPSSAELETGNFSVASNPPKIHLLELKISKFDGDVTNWQTFWQQFEFAIHLNDTLDNINNFNYLLQYLCEDA